MAISMVRKPSETPNMTNIDDIIPFRYAYGNQSGYVISRGAEVSHTVNGNQFTVNSGRLVIQGVESDIDSNGITLTIDSVSETRYYAVYHEINLATNTSNIKVEFDTATYPNITEGDDLTANSSGIARLVLYNFIAQNGVISGVNKVVKAIEYSGTALVGYDISKGTVEERLTKLGFKQGNITFSGGDNIYEGMLLSSVKFSDIAINELKRQGNYVLCRFSVGYSASKGANFAGAGSISLVNAGTIPLQFIPKDKITIKDGVTYITLNTDGTISFYTEVGALGYTNGRLVSGSIGYEGEPL